MRIWLNRRSQPAGSAFCCLLGTRPVLLCIRSLLGTRPACSACAVCSAHGLLALHALSALQSACLFCIRPASPAVVLTGRKFRHSGHRRPYFPEYAALGLAAGPQRPYFAPNGCSRLKFKQIRAVESGNLRKTAFPPNIASVRSGLLPQPVPPPLPQHAPVTRTSAASATCSRNPFLSRFRNMLPQPVLQLLPQHAPVTRTSAASATCSRNPFLNRFRTMLPHPVFQPLPQIAPAPCFRSYASARLFSRSSLPSRRRRNRPESGNRCRSRTGTGRLCNRPCSVRRSTGSAPPG